MRSDSSAICTSVEPVFLSEPPKVLIKSDLRSLVTDMVRVLSLRLGVWRLGQGEMNDPRGVRVNRSPASGAEL